MTALAIAPVTDTEAGEDGPIVDWAVLARSVATRAKAAFCPILAAHGIVRVSIDYDGEGDEGQVHTITAFAADNTIVELPQVDCERHQTHFCGQVSVDIARLSDVLDTFAYEALAMFHQGWENGNGACGKITIDVASQAASLDHNARYVEYDTTATEL